MYAVQHTSLPLEHTPYIPLEHTAYIPPEHTPYIQSIHHTAYIATVSPYPSLYVRDELRCMTWMHPVAAYPTLPCLEASGYPEPLALEPCARA